MTGEVSLVMFLMGFVGLQEGKIHEGAKPAQVAYLKDGKLFTTGFSKMSERQFALWDEVSQDSALSMFVRGSKSLQWMCGLC